MYYLVWTLSQFIFFWLIISLLSRLFQGGRSRRDGRREYYDWTYGSEQQQDGNGWYGNPGGNAAEVTLSGAYRTLEISPDASDNEVRSAFKRLAVKYHPDKYATEPQEVQHKAEENFKKVNEAYQLIRKRRGLDS
ncbi:MAG: J domain-containing protein [Candidatus Cryptobacteroides sp.]